MAEDFYDCIIHINKLNFFDLTHIIYTSTIDGKVYIIPKKTVFENSKVVTVVPGNVSKNRLKFNFDKCLYEEQIIFLKSEFILFKFHQLFLYELKTCELKNVYFFDLFDSIIKISKINNEQFVLLSINKILIVQLKNNNNLEFKELLSFYSTPFFWYYDIIYSKNNLLILSSTYGIEIWDINNSNIKKVQEFITGNEFILEFNKDYFITYGEENINIYCKIKGIKSYQLLNIFEGFEDIINLKKLNDNTIIFQTKRNELYLIDMNEMKTNKLFFKKKFNIFLFITIGNNIFITNGKYIYIYNIIKKNKNFQYILIEIIEGDFICNHLYLNYLLLINNNFNLVKNFKFNFNDYFIEKDFKGYKKIITSEKNTILRNIHETFNGSKLKRFYSLEDIIISEIKDSLKIFQKPKYNIENNKKNYKIKKIKMEWFKKNIQNHKKKFR